MSPVTTVDQPKSVRERVSQSRLGTVLVLVVTAAVVMVGAYLVNPKPSPQGGVTAVNVGPSDVPAPKVGRAAYNFTATTVDGKQVSLSSYKGHPVWLTFGASWCSPCQAEAPDIEAAYKKHLAEGVVVLAIDKEDAPAVLDFAQRVGLTYPQIADVNNSIGDAYRVDGIPAHYFIDKSGILRAVKAGGLSPDQMDAALKEIDG
jgi:peroxiredoxin